VGGGKSAERGGKAEQRRKKEKASVGNKFSAWVGGVWAFVTCINMGTARDEEQSPMREGKGGDAVMKSHIYKDRC